MTIISFLNSKGGVGKSTLTLHVAHGLSIRGKQICVVDADPQGSLRDWYSQSDKPLFEVVGMDTLAQLRGVRKLAQSYDVVIIDAPGHLPPIITACLKATDVAVLPFQPSSLDLWGGVNMVTLVKKRQEVSSLRVCLCGSICNGQDKDSIEELKKVLVETDLPVLKNKVNSRKVYAASIGKGKTAFSSKDSTAKAEIRRFVDGLWSFVQGKENDVIIQDTL